MSSDHECRFVTHEQFFLQLWSAQIEVAMGQSDFLARFNGRSADCKGKWLGPVEDGQFRWNDFDGAGIHVWILGVPFYRFLDLNDKLRRTFLPSSMIGASHRSSMVTWIVPCDRAMPRKSRRPHLGRSGPIPAGRPLDRHRFLGEFACMGSAKQSTHGYPRFILMGAAQYPLLERCASIEGVDEVFVTGGNGFIGSKVVASL